MLRRPTSLYVSLRTTGRVPFRSGACAEPTCHRDRNARAGRLSVLGLNALVSPPPGIPVEGCRRHRLPCICLLRNCQTSIEDAFLTPMRGASPSTAGGVPARRRYRLLQMAGTVAAAVDPPCLCVCHTPVRSLLPCALQQVGRHPCRGAATRPQTCCSARCWARGRTRW